MFGFCATQENILAKDGLSPERRLLWGVRVWPPAVKGSPEGGFITLVWRAESELVLEEQTTCGVKRWGG